MAIRKFVFQGLAAETHKEAIDDLFLVDGIHRIIVSVAFVNSGGVALLADRLKTHKTKTTAFIGVRNDVTSLQGARALQDIGISLYVVDTGSRRVIYHPKIYLVIGATEARMVIGSANLTLGGLNNNIEASVVVHCDLGNAEDRKFVDGIVARFDEQPGEYPENVIRIKAADQLKKLFEKGILVDETAATPPRTAASTSSTGDDSVPRMKLKVTRIGKPAATKAPAPKAAATKAPAKAAPKPAGPAPVPATGVVFERLWQSKELTRRDLDVPVEGRNTNRTGSINLDKGLLPDAIDHRHHFRDEVFDALNWGPKSKDVEEAFAKFQLVIKGVSYGTFDLRIGHSTNVKSATYLQRNAMTRLSWGPLREYVAREDLIGRTLSLYRDKADPKRFMLEID